MKLRERRGAKSRELRARFKEVRGEVHLVVEDPLAGKSHILPADARLYVLREATTLEQGRASQLGFRFVPFEPPIILLDGAGSERVGEIHAWKDGGALYIEGSRVEPVARRLYRPKTVPAADASSYRFKTITPTQREELRAYGYLVPEPD